MKQWRTWLWMLTKRLYKKPAFILLILLIPLLVVGYRISAKEDSGIITVGLAQTQQDPLTDAIFQRLHSGSQLIRYQEFDSPEEARQQLAAGKLDTLWIFPGDMENHVKQFVSDPAKHGGFIKVLEQEDNVALALTRERLNGALYSHVAREVYLQFIRKQFPGNEAFSDEALMAYYHDAEFSQHLFAYENAETAEESSHYLLSPLRGLLGVMIQLCALAAAMHYLQDRAKGTFAWVSSRYRRIPEMVCQLVCVVQIAAVCLICLFLCSLGGNVLRELAVTLLFSLCACAFAMMLRALCNSLPVLAVLLPVLCIGMLIACPVFFDPGAVRYLFPPTYYIYAQQNGAYLLYMTLYTLVCGGVWYLAGKLKKA